MKIEYEITKKEDRKIEVKDIKNCFFKYYNGYNGYFGIYKTGEYFESGEREQWTCVEINNGTIYFETFRGLECGTFPIESKIRSFFQYKDKIQEISQEEFEKERRRVFNDLIPFNENNKKKNY